MLQTQDAFAPGAAEDIDDMAHAEALSDTVDAGKSLAGLFGNIIELRRIQTDVAVAAWLMLLFSEITEEYLSSTAPGFGKGDHGIELVDLYAFLLHVPAQFNEAAGHHDIAVAKKKHGLGRETVAAGPTCFLIVAFNIFGKVVVKHKADIGFVDTHTEGHRGDDYLEVVLQEVILDLLALLGVKSGVICGSRKTC